MEIKLFLILCLVAAVFPMDYLYAQVPGRSRWAGLLSNLRRRCGHLCPYSGPSGPHRRQNWNGQRQEELKRAQEAEAADWYEEAVRYLQS